MEIHNTPDPVRIIIVDDHPNTAAMLARVLGKLESPVEVITASSGEEALQKINDHPVDIMITDYMMPGMNGLSLIENLVGERKPAHIILTTAYDTPELSIMARQLNIQDYLVKPVQPEKIRGIVSRVIAEMRPQHQKINMAAHRTYKILVADDNPDNIRLLSTHVQSEGYIFIAAWNGEDVLEKLRSEQPDLILLDVNLPKKDGFQVLSEMHSDPALAHIPAIIITATRIDPKDVRDGLLVGADDYIIKPIDWRELAARIQLKLRVKHTEDVLRRKVQEWSILPAIGRALSTCQKIDDLGEIILAPITAALVADAGWLEIFQPDGSAICWEHHADAESPLKIRDTKENIVSREYAAQAVITRTGILVNNVLTDTLGRGLPMSENVGSAIAFPLLGRKNVHGIITLVHNQSNYFNEDMFLILEAVTHQVSAAIDYFSLGQTLEEERLLHTRAMTLSSESTLAETQALYDIIAEINASVSYSDILSALANRTILGQADQLLLIGLFNHPIVGSPLPEWIYPVASRSNAAIDIASRYPFTTFQAEPGTLFTDFPVIIEDISADHRLDKISRTLFQQVFHVASSIIIPLKAGESSIGFIQGYFGEHIMFSKDDIQRLVVIASQAAVVIQSQLLLEQAQSKAQQERRIREITTKIFYAVDIDTILRHTVEQVGKALGVQSYIFLGNADEEEGPNQPTSSAQ